MSRWPLRNSYFWQEAPLFRPFLFLVAGIICCDQGWIGAYHSGIAVSVLVASGVMIVVSAFIHDRKWWIDGLYLMTFGFFFTAVGWNVYSLSNAGNSSESVRIRTDTNSLTLVRIKEQPLIKNATTKLVVELLGVVRNDEVKPLAGSALLYVYNRPGISFHEHDTLLVPSNLQPIRNRGNPFEMDYAGLQRRRGVLFQQFVTADRIIPFGRSISSGKNILNKAHDWCNKELGTYIHDSATLGLMQAMLLGDESNFDPELRQAYSQTGVIHIVSISGSHVAVLYLVVTGILYWMRGRRGNWVKYIVGLLLVWIYVLMAGGPPSALRSALMFSVIALSTLSDREGNGLNTTIAAAFALLLYQPAWLFAIGFQLSFGAVLGMMIFYQPIYRLWYWPKKRWITRKTWQAVAASFAAEILTAPLVAYYFHNFPLLFLFANLLAAVVVGLCALVGGMGIIAFCWITPLAQMLGWIVTWLVRIFNDCITWMQGLTMPSLQHLQINAVKLLLIYTLIIGMGIWWLRKVRAGMFICMGAGCLLMALFNYDLFVAMKQERLIVYNNGRLPAIDVIRGQHFQAIAGTEDGYNAKTAHIGYHAWREDNRDITSPYFIIGNKKVLALTDSTVQSYSTSLPVDVLVLARPLRFMHIGEVLRAFSPKEIVLGVRSSPYQIQRWKDTCTVYGVHLYDVAEKGAYISE